MNKIYIIGVGPGSKDYMLPIAREEIEKADCLIGARRILSEFEHLDKEKVYLEGNFKGVLSYLEEHRAKKRIAVLVSGDAGLYSFLGQLENVFNKNDYVVVPGVSTVQVAFARIGQRWQHAKIISLHGREIENLEKEIKPQTDAFLFTDNKFPPGKIAEYLLNKGIENRKAIVFENLSYPNEKIVDADLVNLKNMNGFGLCVMIIKKR